MPYVYEREAVDCPAPQECPDDLSLYADPPLPDTFDAVIEGAAGAQGMRAKLNRNALRTELVAREGAGFVGITRGLDLSAAGLVATVSAGRANISGPVELEDDTTLALANNTDNFIWISKNGGLNKRTAADGDPLLPPDTDSTWCYLGMIPVASGTPGDIDLSGVIYLRGIPYRRTADATTPVDTPPANARFITRGSSQWWLWDGEEYVSPLDPGFLVIAEGGDPDPGALDAKTLAGTGIALAVVTDSGVKKLQISTDPGALTYKAPCRVASTANVNTASPGASIDGVALSNGDRVLLKDQTTASQNGVWVWNGAASAMTRATDADAAAEVVAGMLVPVTAGDTQADTLWALLTDGAVTVGTTDLNFGQLSAVRHTEEFTVPIAQEVGAICEYEVDFSERGSFAAAWDYHVRLTKDQAGVRVTVLDNDRTGSSFRVLVQVAYNAPDGTYGDYGELELELALQGHRWTPGSSPSATPVATLDTYDYEGSAAEGGPVQRVRVAAATGTIPDNDGADLVVTGTYGEAGPLSLELPAAPVSMQKVTIVAGTTTPVNVSPGDGEWPGGSSISLDNEGSSCVFQCIWPPNHSGPGAPPVWALLAYVDATITP